MSTVHFVRQLGKACLKTFLWIQGYFLASVAFMKIICALLYLLQSSIQWGHTILILEKHRKDITDDFSQDELPAFIKAINLVSTHLKKQAKDERDKLPCRIYVSSLCDGVKHLHAHLIPRYPYTPADENIYEQLFLERDGRATINRNMQSSELGGFWYVTERERNHKKSRYGQMLDQDKVSYLEGLARKLHMRS